MESLSLASFPAPFPAESRYPRGDQEGNQRAEWWEHGMIDIYHVLIMDLSRSFHDINIISYTYIYENGIPQISSNIHRFVGKPATRNVSKF